MRPAERRKEGDKEHANVCVCMCACVCACMHACVCVTAALLLLLLPCSPVTAPYLGGVVEKAGDGAQARLVTRLCLEFCIRMACI